jgi:hypothetical protein
MSRSCCYCVYEFGEEPCRQIIIDVITGIDVCIIHGVSEIRKQFTFDSFPSKTEDHLAKYEKFEHDTGIKLPDEDFSVLLVDTWFKEASYDGLSLSGRRRNSVTFVSECEDRDEFYESNEYKFLVAYIDAARNLAAEEI